MCRWMSARSLAVTSATSKSSSTWRGVSCESTSREHAQKWVSNARYAPRSSREVNSRSTSVSRTTTYKSWRRTTFKSLSTSQPKWWWIGVSSNNWARAKSSTVWPSSAQVESSSKKTWWWRARTSAPCSAYPVALSLRTRNSSTSACTARTITAMTAWPIPRTSISRN